MKKIILVLTLAAIVIFPLVSSAGQMENAVSFGIISWEPDDLEESDMLLSGSFRHMMKENFALQFEMGRWEHSETEEGITATVEIFVLGGSGLFFPSPLSTGSAACYIGGGISNYDVEVSVLGLSASESDIGFHFLAGVEYPIAKSTSIYGELRMISAEVEEIDISGITFGGGIRVLF